ncbi:MAG: hypothetical protein KDI73_01185 [Candidatus Competibacteraceae bacterium]|nr:hypothetical protein [Candidatus Competibacteraceae bacterium]
MGDAISFTLNLTHNAPSGSPPDSFAFFLLDSAVALPLFETTDLLGGALFAVTSTAPPVERSTTLPQPLPAQR